MKEGREIDKNSGFIMIYVSLFSCNVDDAQAANSYFDGSGDVVLVIDPFLGMSRTRRQLFKRQRDCVCRF